MAEALEDGVKIEGETGDSLTVTWEKAKAKMRKAAVESVRANFSTAKMCEKTLALYRELHGEAG